MTEVLSVVMLFIPLFVVTWLANVAQARRTRGEPYQGLVITALLFMAAFYAGAFLMGLLVQVIAVAVRADPEAFAEAAGPLNVASWDLLAVGLWGPALAGLLLLLPAVRRAVARFVPLDPDNPVHAVALSFTMLVMINLVFTLGVGLDNLADLMATARDMRGEEDGSGYLMASLWVQQVLTALLAMVGVGWLTRLDWRGALARLGVTPMSAQQWLVGVGVGVGLVPAMLLLERLFSLIGWGAQADVARLTEVLIGALFESPFGILTLGLSAALGEETIFRGALQPRFGLLLTSLLFALVHSNYGITFSTLIVFLIGMLFGWLRIRHNTSTAMVAHAVYNMTLGLLAYLGVSLVEY
jgi:membrane protease YdiL (CAAX protease family)